MPRYPPYRLSLMSSLRSHIVRDERAPARQRIRREGRGAFFLRVLNVGLPAGEAAASRTGVPIPRTGGLLDQIRVSKRHLYYNRTSTD